MSKFLCTKWTHPAKDQIQSVVIPVDYTAFYFKVGLFLLAKAKCASPMTILTGNKSICLGIFSKRGLRHSSFFSVYFLMGLF